ncbi:hypothetical protein [uncultured Microbulbifer sp.]|uniref:hypothetical protein n=1 Tax=uncultured Microbulbifer sp. TaxID=348147 RepID=UPI0026049402|nr:hypothetical protein [uncultured Microbulbifer sp.]
MLLDIYGQKGMDEFNDNLLVLDRLLESKNFLTGISPSFDMTAIDVEALSSFTVINKCSWAIEMLDLDGMQEKQCPYTYQYYAGMHNISFLKTGNKKEFSKQKEIMDRINSCRKNEDDYFYVQRKVENRFGALGISNFLAENYCTLGCQQKR